MSPTSFFSSFLCGLVALHHQMPKCLPAYYHIPPTYLSTTDGLFIPITLHYRQLPRPYPRAAIDKYTTQPTWQPIHTYIHFLSQYLQFQLTPTTNQSAILPLISFQLRHRLRHRLPIVIIIPALLACPIRLLRRPRHRRQRRVMSE